MPPSEFPSIRCQVDSAPLPPVLSPSLHLLGSFSWSGIWQHESKSALTVEKGWAAIQKMLSPKKESSSPKPPAPHNNPQPAATRFGKNMFYRLPSSARALRFDAPFSSPIVLFGHRLLFPGVWAHLLKRRIFEENGEGTTREAANCLREVFPRISSPFCRFLLFWEPFVFH